MPEPVDLLPSSPDQQTDLSAGTLSESDVQKANFGLKEFDHRVSQQGTAASTAIVWASILFTSAIGFGASFVYALIHKAQDLSWHATIIVGAFVVPPTIILVALIRAVYSPNKSDEGSPVPAIAFLKELAAAIAAVFKATKPG